MSSVTIDSKLMKLVLVGESGVGKTSFFLKYCDGKAPDIGRPPQATINDDIRHKEIVVENKRRKKTMVKLQMCDTAGQEKFGTLTSSLYRSAQGIFLCYDISDKDSFERITSWKIEITKYAPPDAVMILIGMKCDLGAQRQVLESEGKALADSWNIPFFEISSKTNMNVDVAVAALAQKVAGSKETVSNVRKSPDANVKVKVRRNTCNIL